MKKTKAKKNVWESIYDGARPKREKLALPVIGFIKSYGDEALAELTMEDDELKTLISKMPIKLLYIVCETMAELASRQEDRV